jgi:hypothetical protein
VIRDLNQLILARKGGAKMNLVGAGICGEFGGKGRRGEGERASSLRPFTEYEACGQLKIVGYFVLHASIM